MYLYRELKELRYEFARKEKKPAFCICSNESIIEMVNNKPSNKEEMLSTRGIGESFINNYSDEFLEIIHNALD